MHLPVSWSRMREAAAASSQPQLQRGGANPQGVEQDADGDYDSDGVWKDCPDCETGLKADGSTCPTCNGAGAVMRESAIHLQRLLAATTERLREAKPETLGSTFGPVSATTAGGNKAYEVVLIREGLGSGDPDSPKNRWYSKHGIQELAASKLCEGMQAYADHPSLDEEELLPERSVRDMVGSYRNVQLAESGGRAELRATFVPVKGPGYEWVDSLAEAAVNNQTGKDLVGISFYGAAAGDDRERPDGSFGPVADLIRPTSGDIVTNAGAGGKFVRQLMESARAKRAANPPREGVEPMKIKLSELPSKLRESVSALREADTDEKRTTAIDALAGLADAEVELTAADRLNGLEVGPLKESKTLWAQIREAIKPEFPAPVDGTADEKDAKIAKLEGELGETQSRLAESEKGHKAVNGALLGMKVMREAKVPEDEAEFYLGKFRESGAHTEDAMRAIIKSEQDREAKIVERVRESAGLGMVEGMPGNTGGSSDGLLDLSDAGVPMVEPEPAAV